MGRNRDNIQQFIQKAQKIHKDKYEYSLADYVHSQMNVIIICPKHGQFKQTPNNHLKRKGCPKCAIERRINSCRDNTKKFIQKAQKIHKDTYDYSKVNYINARTNIDIICLKHGKFSQNPNSHLNKKGCPKCTKIVSKNGAKWLNDLNITIREYKIYYYDNRGFYRHYIVDGLDKINKIVYEFLGIYWHGNSKLRQNNYSSKYRKLAKKRFRKT